MVPGALERRFGDARDSPTRGHRRFFQRPGHVCALMACTRRQEPRFGAKTVKVAPNGQIWCAAAPAPADQCEGPIDHVKVAPGALERRFGDARDSPTRGHRRFFQRPGHVCALAACTRRAETPFWPQNRQKWPKTAKFGARRPRHRRTSARGPLTMLKWSPELSSAVSETRGTRRPGGIADSSNGQVLFVHWRPARDACSTRSGPKTVKSGRFRSNLVRGGPGTGKPVRVAYWSD